MIRSREARRRNKNRNIRDAAAGRRRRGRETAGHGTASSSPLWGRWMNCLRRKTRTPPSSAIDAVSWPVPFDRSAPARSTATRQTTPSGRPDKRSSPSRSGDPHPESSPGRSSRPAIWRSSTCRKAAAGAGFRGKPSRPSAIPKMHSGCKRERYSPTRGGRRTPPSGSAHA